MMTTVQLIEEQIQHLDNQSFAALRNWFVEYEHTRWDRQIASDSEAGKLDFMIDEALSEHRAGKTNTVKHSTASRFWRCYDALPEDVRALANKTYELLKNNPRHPSLHFK